MIKMHFLFIYQSKWLKTVIIIFVCKKLWCTLLHLVLLHQVHNISDHYRICWIIETLYCTPLKFIMFNLIPLHSYDGFGYSEISKTKSFPINLIRSVGLYCRFSNCIDIHLPVPTSHLWSQPKFIIQLLTEVLG